MQIGEHQSNAIKNRITLLYTLFLLFVTLLTLLINADKKIKEMQIGDHEIERVNFANNNIIFLRDITCLNRIQVILKLFENALAQ